jgi:hypothetical protein
MKPTTILIIMGFVGIAILSINTMEVFSADKKNLVTGFNDKNSAESFFVTITDGNGDFSFNTVSRIGIVRSDNPQFLLESVPSHDNKEFLKFVSKSLNTVSTNPSFFDVAIEILAKDGTTIETFMYKKCIIDEYFAYTNDSKGTYSLLNRDSSKSEIRDVTKFDCIRLDIKV